MAEGFKLSRKISGEAQELLIRAQVEDADGKAWHAATFEKSRVDYITEISEGLSGIVLKSDEGSSPTKEKSI